MMDVFFDSLRTVLYTIATEGVYDLGGPNPSLNLLSPFPLLFLTLPFSSPPLPTPPLRSRPLKI